ncbi:MAG: cupredoxin domain-containing protein, partial [Thermoplasmata archaeon]|nr:cupredoxin domain-containing protein [Thermoplasmata archaeon]
MGQAAARRTSAALAVAFLVTIAVFGVAQAAPNRPAGIAHPGATDQLTVTVGTAFAFTLSTDMVTPGDTVDLTVIQTDGVDHTFTLSSMANFALDPTKSTSVDVAAFFQAHPPLVNISVPGGSGTVHSTFIAPPFGEYQYLCLAAGHFQAGMFGNLGSGEHGTSGSVYDGPGAPVFIIGGIIVSL